MSGILYTRSESGLMCYFFRTFLKRKGGLFKKAHELSVLCSVDVAVIIFGHNKKLYEYSSGDINETIGRFQYVRSLLQVLPSQKAPSTQYQSEPFPKTAWQSEASENQRAAAV